MQPKQLLSPDQANTMLELFADRDIAPIEGVDGRTLNALLRRGLIQRQGVAHLRITPQGREVCKRNPVQPVKMKVRQTKFRGLDMIGHQLDALPICEHGGGRTALLIVCHTLFDMQKVQKKVDTFNAILEHAGKGYEFITQMSEHNVLVYKLARAAEISAAS